jgi:hypothetical protein
MASKVTVYSTNDEDELDSELGVMLELDVMLELGCSPEVAPPVDEATIVLLELVELEEDELDPLEDASEDGIKLTIKTSNNIPVKVYTYGLG